MLYIIITIITIIIIITISIIVLGWLYNRISANKQIEQFDGKMQNIDIGMDLAFVNNPADTSYNYISFRDNKLNVPNAMVLTNKSLYAI